MIRVLLSLMLIAASLMVARADTGPSVLVRTLPVKQGSLARTVTGYGTIEPGPAARRTLTLAHAGIVDQVAVLAGSRVRKGEALAVIDTAPAARARYDEAVAALDTARQDLAHTRSLLGAHLATRSQLAQAEQAEAAARARLAALKLEGAGHRRQTLTAPFDGVVARVAVGPGASVPPGAPILTVVRADALIARIGLDPAMASHVHAGAGATVVSLAGGAAVHGTLRSIAAMINPRSGLVDATIALPGGGPLLGERVKVAIDAGRVHGVIVPHDAALPAGDGFAIWQVKAGQAQPVRVKILAHTAQGDVVSGRIDPSLPIVSTGDYQLSPGMNVRTTP